VVIAIIAILASLLLPAMHKATQQSQKAKCLSNLRQIGIGMKMYIDDHLSTFPPAQSEQVDPEANPDYVHGEDLGGIDGSDPGPRTPPAKKRLLAPYVPTPEAFHCPADHGWISPTVKAAPTTFNAWGCSYRFNHYLQQNYQDAGLAEDPVYNLGLKKEAWAPEPARFVVMHEPAAYPWFTDTEPTVEITQWHEASSPGRVFSASSIQADPDKLVAPVLFVDGHGQQCDFSANLKQNPLRGLEPGKDWIWYKPVRK
jgi:type II secretory pathway pseudopilin PulG